MSTHPYTNVGILQNKDLKMTVTTVRSNCGKFNVNFKGGCVIPIDFDYVCLSCRGESTLRHERSETMHGRVCGDCGGELSRHITQAPTLDADYHDRCKSHNLGWES